MGENSLKTISFYYHYYFYFVKLNGQIQLFLFIFFQEKSKLIKYIFILLFFIHFF